MPTTTPRLGLKIPLGNETHNRTNYTENLQIMEANAAKKADLDAHLADEANKHKASNISVADAGNHFTASDVEGVLSELFSSVSEGKGLIATALTGKGVSATGSESFAELAGMVASAGSSIKSVQRGTVVLASGSSEIPVNISAVDRSKSLIVFYVMGNTGANVSPLYLLSSFVSNSQIKFTRTGSWTTYDATIYYEVIEFLSGVSVQYVTGTFLKANTSQTFTISNIDTSKSFVAGGSNTYPSNSLKTNQSEVGYKLTDSTTLTLYRGYADNIYDIPFSIYIVTFN